MHMRWRFPCYKDTEHDRKIVSDVFTFIWLNTVKKSQWRIIMSLAQKNKVLLN